MTEELEKGFYRLKIDQNMKWFPRPTGKCSGDYYTEKVKLLVNWFKFTAKITDRPYYEYKVQMYKIKTFKNRQGKTETKKTIIPILSRPELFWKHLRHEREQQKKRNQHFDIEEYVFDNKETVYSVNIHKNPIKSEMPCAENKNVTYVLELTLWTEFCLLFSQEDPHKAEEVNKSYKFLKDVVTQKVRYSPEENDRVAVEFIKNFVYDSNVIHRIPESFYDPSRFEHELEIAPRIEAWFGVYIAVKELFDGQPVLNFGIVHKLFYNAPILSLLDYLLLIVDPETRKDEHRNARKRQLRDGNFNIKENAFGQVNRLLENLKLKSTEVFDEEKGKMTERHLSFIGLVEQNSKNCQISYSVRKGREVQKRRASLFEIYHYNRKPVEFPDLPVVRVKSGTKEYRVPMEYLQVHEKPQRFKNLIDMRMQDRFIKAATRKPHVYQKETIEMLKDLDFDSKEGLDFVKKFGLCSELKMIECPGKVLKEPRLVNKDNEPIKMTPVVRGFQEKQLNVVPAKELCCAIFVLRGQNETEACLRESHVFQLYEELIDGCEFRGLRVGKNETNRAARSLLQWKDDNGTTKYAHYSGCPLIESASSFLAAATDAKRQFDRLPDADQKALLFIVIGTPMYNAYGYVKYHCDTRLGVASQYINVHTANQILKDLPKSHRIAYQLALKINAKLGGVNQELDWSESAEMSPEEKEARKAEPLKMFVGIDVTHPTNGSGIDFSIASIVASINPSATKYRNRVITQQECRPGERPVAHGRERTDILEGKFIHLLREFAENNNNRAPDHIVIYRDGVSDSEMLRVSHDELKSLKSEVQQFLEERSAEPARHPNYTYIVVQKRHHTRFFRQMGAEPKTSEGAQKRYADEMKETENSGIANVSSGTVVDKLVVSPYKFDFWLSSHHGAIGTSRPCHYTVMYDDANLTQDIAYKMTYELAFLSVRCRKPISLPAPVHYAHLACEKAKEVYKAASRQQIHEIPPIGTGRSLGLRAKLEEIMQPSQLYPGMSFA